MPLTIDIFYWSDESEWQEAKHPRAKGGQFSSVPGSSGSGAQAKTPQQIQSLANIVVQPHLHSPHVVEKALSEIKEALKAKGGGPAGLQPYVEKLEQHLRENKPESKPSGGRTNSEGAYEALPMNHGNIDDETATRIGNEFSEKISGESSSEDYKKLVGAHAEAFRTYSNSTYSAINSACRDGNVNDSKYSQQIKSMDAWFDKPESKIKSDVVAYRGARLPGFVWSKVQQSLDDGKPVILSDKAFVSTTLKRSVADVFGTGGIVMRVTVKRGTGACWMGDKMSNTPKEMEMLLQRGTQFYVKSILDIRGKKVLDVEVRPNGRA